MAYDSINGKRPIEYASKINHSSIINSPEIKEFLEEYETIELDLGKHVLPQSNEIKFGTPKDITHIISVDGSFQDAVINKRFPSIVLTYFNVGALIFKMHEYDKLSSQQIIDPALLKELKNVSKVCFAVPTNNILKKGYSNFIDSYRVRINEIFSNKKYSCLHNDTLNTVLEWIIFEKWELKSNSIRITCPNENCAEEIEFAPNEHIKKCPCCGKEVFLTDYLKLYELINEPSGASRTITFLCNTIEQLFIAEIIREFYNTEPELLGKIVFLKDGPLAFFSKTFKLCSHYRSLFSYLESNNILIYLVGLEKSGAFVDHAVYIKDKLSVGKYYIFNESYIKKYVEPTDSTTFYGYNTYYGKKLMYKTEAGDVLVVTVPVKAYKPELAASELIGAEVCLQTLSKLRCNMYDNSLVPIAIINKLVSLSDLPSANILEKFSKQQIN